MMQYQVDMINRQLYAADWFFTNNWLEQESAIEDHGGYEVIRMAGMFTKQHPGIFTHIEHSSMVQMAAESKAAGIMEDAAKRKVEWDSGEGSGDMGGGGASAAGPPAKARRSRIPAKPMQPKTATPNKSSPAPAKWGMA